MPACRGPVGGPAGPPGPVTVGLWVTEVGKEEVTVGRD